MLTPSEGCLERVQKALVVVYWKSSPESADKKVLLLQVIDKRGSFWQPVTGKMDPGETYPETALREAEEETGFRFERQPQYLGLEYEFQGRWGPAVERAFFLPVFGPTPPTPTLDPKEHQAFRWVSPEEALQLAKFPANQDAIRRVTFAPPPLLLAKTGALFQEGEEITHERTRLLLLSSLTRATSGIYFVKIGQEELDVVVEDTPLFARAYDRATGMLSLSDGTKEKLKPESLRVGADQSFRCQVERGWPARLLSPAHYEIAKDIREGSMPGEYVLHFLGQDHLLRVAH